MLVDDTLELQYKVELYLAGFTDTRSNDCGVHDAVSELRRREHAMNEFRSLQKTDLLLSMPGHPTVNRNILAERTESTADFAQLTPEPLWGLPLRWSLTFDFPVDNIQVYPEDNLLVASEPT